MQLQIETTNVCDADCVFCMYSQQRRPKGTMAMPLFRRIVDEAATIPQIDQITLTGLGEPLLDRFVVDRVKYIRSVMKAIPIDIFTNGSYLRPQMTRDLIDAGVSLLNVSLNGVDRAQRQQIMKLDNYEEVVAYIRYARACGAGKMRVVVKGVVSKDLMEVGDTEQFENQWREPALPDGSVFLHLEGNWAGKVWASRTVQRKPCNRALNQIMVLWDGRVSLCCFDGDGEDIFGDLTTQTIRDIFNGGRALEVRTAHIEGRRADIDLCRGCTAI
jgi:sulfatase maturation enzyme AslB (radical SAM superfamily)